MTSPTVLTILCTYVVLMFGYASTTRFCFYGGTNSCQFTCHCKNNQKCVTDGVDSGSCLSGVCADGWSGAGCQAGNIALGGSVSTRRGSHMEEVMDEYSTATCGTFVRSNGGIYLDLDLKSTSVIFALYLRYENIVPNVILSVGDSENMNNALVVEGQENITGRLSEIELNEPVIGRYIRVEYLVLGNGIRVCDLIVHGYKYYNCVKHEGDYRYGPACTQRCHCKGPCHVITGYCDTCLPGYVRMNGRCTSHCPWGYWGPDCERQCNCGVTCEVPCDRDDGSCTYILPRYIFNALLIVGSIWFFLYVLGYSQPIQEEPTSHRNHSWPPKRTESEEQHDAPEDHSSQQPEAAEPEEKHDAHEERSGHLPEDLAWLFFHRGPNGTTLLRCRVNNTQEPIN